MSPTLRPYQAKLVDDVFDGWNGGARNVLAVLPTGGGKTVCFSEIIRRHAGPACAIAHRQELASQMSVALARNGIRHRVIGSASLQRGLTPLHIGEVGRSYVDPTSMIAVAGVDTLVRHDPNDPWLRSVTLWVLDESHHGLTRNKWGKAAAMFPNARGLGVTATPVRADGKGLGSHADGLMDAMVVGPSMRELIDAGYLTDYRIFAPPSDLDLSQVATSAATGEFSPPQLRSAIRKSHITGDVVAHYTKLAAGKLGVTFAVDIESAREIAAGFREAGVPAEVVTGETPDGLRAEILRRFRRREVMQLVNVDLFGEGFDLPAIEVVSMARPTQSFSLFCQQFGRSLRIMDGKNTALIIDHVGNTLRHGLPDAPRAWTLDARERRGGNRPTDVIPTRTCPMCTAVFERVMLSCPECGHYPEPASRSSPQQVDGDLMELDAATLAAMRGEIARVDGPPAFPRGVDAPTAGAIKKRHWERQQAQGELRRLIATWAGWQRALGRSDQEGYRRFYFRYGVDVATAQSLGTPETTALAAKIADELQRAGVDAQENKD